MEWINRYPSEWDGEKLVAWCHQVCRELGLSRVRVDRHQTPDHEYVEVGYGCGTVRVRTSWGGLWEVTRENYQPKRFWDLLEMVGEHA